MAGELVRLAGELSVDKFDGSKTGVFEAYKPSKAPEIVLGLIVMVLLVATLVWLLSVA